MIGFCALVALCAVAACSTDRLTGAAAEDAARQYQASAMESGPTPLIVVDGSEISADAARKLAPESIESIEVVKGAAAVQVYGERAKAGAVIIRLKESVRAPLTPASL